MRSSPLFLALLLSAGCGTDSTDTATETAAPPFTPAAGTWNLSAPDVSVDSCNVKDLLQQNSADPITAALVNTAEGTFSLTVDGQPETADCTLTDQAFTCNEKTLTRTEAGMDLTIKTTMSGAFTSEKLLSLTIGTSTECVGDTCALISGWPCQLEGTTIGTMP